MMTKKMKRYIYILLVATIMLISGCDPVSNPGDDKTPDSSNDDRENLYSEIIVNKALPTVYEEGLSAEDWTTYFTITDEDDGEVKVTEDMLSWDPTYDYSEVGVYTLTCTYTNSLGNTSSESVQIEVVDGETPQEGIVGVEIIDNDLMNQFIVGSAEPMWIEYFTVYNNGLLVETTDEMISFSPSIDMSIEGDYTLSINYVDEIGISHSLTKTITIISDSQFDDIEAMTIYDILYQTYAFDTVRIDGLEVVGIDNQKFIGALNGEYILINNYGSIDSKIIETLNPGDIVNVVGSIYMSNGFSLNIELAVENLQLVSVNNEPTTRYPSFIELSDLFDISYLEFLTTLRETVVTYDNSTNLLSGLRVLNSVEFEDNVEYQIEFVMVNHYEGYEPEIFVLSYEIYEDDGDDTPSTPPLYNPMWIYDNGNVVSIVVDIVSTNGIDTLVGYINDIYAAEAHVVIIDVSNTSFNWLITSLIEGGQLSMTAEVIRTDNNNNDGYGFKLKPLSVVYIDEAEPVLFGKTYGLGSTRLTTAADFEDDLLYNIDYLGIIPLGEQGYVYEMTAQYDPTTNTIGGLAISSSGVELNHEKEYTIQFVVSKYFEDSPYAEIIILSPFYEMPCIYTLNNDIGNLRNLIVSNNNGIDSITAIDSTGTTTFTIDIPESLSYLLTTLVEGDEINVIGEITSNSYDTLINVFAIEIEEISD